MRANGRHDTADGDALRIELVNDIAVVWIMTSPARRQYLDLKAQHPDAILLYRLGDFYEMFDADAEVASKILGIQLTARSYPRGEGRVPMAGVPHHAVSGYIKRLLDAGQRVALCDQTSPAGKGLVDREVVRVFTAGTLAEADMLEPTANNYLSAIYPGKAGLGLAFVDITTGEFALTQFEGPSSSSDLEAELLRLNPAECIVPEGLTPALAFPPGVQVTKKSEYLFNPRGAASLLSRQLQVQTLEGFGCQEAPMGVVAAGAIISYLEETNRRALDQIRSLRTYSTSAFMVLDRYTRSSLELVHPARERRWSLLRVLDRTKTGMGSRRLREMVGQPLIEPSAIERRQDIVESLVSRPMEVVQIGKLLTEVGDVERITGRIVQGTARPSDILDLREALQVAGQVAETVARAEHPHGKSYQTPLDELVAGIDSCPDLVDLIGRSVDAQADGGIAPGYSKELDEIRKTLAEARQSIAAFESREVASSGIKSLKVGLQQSLRLLPRGRQVPCGPGAGSISSTADVAKRRTLLHRRAEAIGGTHPRGEGVDWRTREAAL